jgi:hypothetical protein
MTEAEPNAFGYFESEVLVPFSVQVTEGQLADDLHERVMIRFRLVDDGPQVSYSLHPDTAEQVAAELLHWARQAKKDRES